MPDPKSISWLPSTSTQDAATSAGDEGRQRDADASGDRLGAAVEQLLGARAGHLGHQPPLLADSVDEVLHGQTVDLGWWRMPRGRFHIAEE